MEASRERTTPEWLPSALEPDALRETFRGLKEKYGDSPAEVAASLREKYGDSPAEVAASLRENLRGLTAPGPGQQGAPGAGAPADSAGATLPRPPFEERPELYVGAAFAGGLALAGVLRLLGR
ncbi:MAG: hypothetical protein M3088_03600 [Actinomycetota bacterium]|nr:hypothetical protein [Actinomycetota bacterium]